MAIAVNLSGGIVPSTVEQGGSTTISINYGNSGNDTGFGAKALLTVPPNLHIVSPNPTLLGEIAPGQGGNCSFTANVGEDSLEGNYVCSAAIMCEERHFPERRKVFRFLLNLNLTVVESPKKKTARISVEKAESAIKSLADSIHRLQLAGGIIEDLELERGRLAAELQKSRDLLVARTYEKVIGDSELVISTSNRLNEESIKQLEQLRVKALEAIRASEELRKRISWAGTQALANYDELTKSANSLYQEGRYSDAFRMASTSPGTLPRKPLVVHLDEIWNTLSQKKRLFGLILSGIGVILTLVLLLAAFDGIIPLLSIVISIAIALIGLGLSLRQR